jgi:hypothetical protein
MAIDPDEKLVYSGPHGFTRPWWLTGVVRPGKGAPRDVVWDLTEGNMRLRLTLDLRTLKLYAALLPR